MKTTRTTWTDSTPAARELAFSLVPERFYHQRNVIRGTDNLSGSTLRGQASRYSGHYARSRTALLAKLRSAGIKVSERIEAHGARVLVLRTAFDAFDPSI